MPNNKIVAMIESYDENVLSTPYIMALREYVFGVRKNVGLFIPKKCVSWCKWRRNCAILCESASCDHYKNLKSYQMATKSGDEIDGYIIMKPKFLILSASGPLKVVDGVNKGSVSDLEFKLYKHDKTAFSIVNKYKFLFLDEANKPLHEIAVQFTCKGTCAMTLLQQLKLWNASVDSFCYRNNYRAERDNKYLWTFAPLLEQRMMGKSNASAAACCFVGYEFEKDDTTKTYEKHYTGIIPETMNVAKMQRDEGRKWRKAMIAGDSLSDNVLDVFNYSDDEDDNVSPGSRKRVNAEDDCGVEAKSAKVLDF